MALVGTGYSGNWYSIVGSVASVRAELNRVNAKPQNICGPCVGPNSSNHSVTVLVGRP